MIVRDLDVLVEAARRADVSRDFSVPDARPEIWRHDRTRHRAAAPAAPGLKRARRRGIKASVGLAPILPGLSDKPELLEDVVKAARDAGATGVWANVLYLRPGTREHFLDHLARDWPELRRRYERLYARRAYLGKDVTGPLQATISELRREYGVADRREKRLLPRA